MLGYFVAKFTSTEIRAAHNDRAGFILAVIGVIYAVLARLRRYRRLGALPRGGSAHATRRPARLARLSRRGVVPQRGRLRGDAARYLHSMIDDEWPHMHRGEKSDDLERTTRDGGTRRPRAPGHSLRLQNIHAQMLAAMDTALVDRQTRLTIDFIGINAIMWIVLIVGAY